MNLKQQFDEAIKNSLKYTGHPNTKRKDNKYYDDAYAEVIKKDFGDEVVSYETNYNSRLGCTPICAYASSGRLCYLYFKPKNAEFEKPLYNDLNNSYPTKMDAVIGIDNYECKCQEIVGASHTALRDTYLKSDLFKELVGDLSNIKIVPEEIDEESGQNKKKLCFNVSKLNIKLAGDPDYAHLHFDLKQLICHLIAIANNNHMEKRTLTYVFFQPNEKEIEKHEKVKTLYEDLKKEIKAIFKKDTAIYKFADDHNITPKECKFVSIDSPEVEDFVYKEIFETNK